MIKHTKFGSFTKAFDKTVRDMVTNYARKTIGGIRDPKTGEFPTVIIRNNDLENFSVGIEGSPALLENVKKRLGQGNSKVAQMTDTTITRPKAFLSYASEDKEIAGKIANALQGWGIETWWDEWCIRPGDSLRQRIDEGLTECSHFIVLLTPISVEKPWVNLEMDAALIQKIKNKCKFIPLRHDMTAEKLPPSLAGMLSPQLSNFNEDMQELVNDIYDVTRRPPLGTPPEAVSTSVDADTGYSSAATAIAKIFVERSERGLLGDPHMTMEKVSKLTGLSKEDIEDVLHELSAFFNSNRYRFMVKEELFVTFDQYWQPWNPIKDALKIATDTRNDENFPTVTEEIAKHYGWQPRRMNPAAAYLINRGIFMDQKTIGSSPWFTKWLTPKDGETRRFVNSRSRLDK